MIARVTLELALRKEFDYLIPLELTEQIDVGSRVQVPLGARKVLGCVTAVAEESAQTKLKPILKVIGAETLVTLKILKLARWIGDYYCCAPETALKSVLPDAVRHEQAGWRERLVVRALPSLATCPSLPNGSRTYGILSKNDGNWLSKSCSIWLRQPLPQYDASKIKDCWRSRPKSPSATLTPASTSCRRCPWP